MNQWIVVGGVAVLVLLLARKVKADSAASAYSFNPQNWRTLPGYIAAQGNGVVT